MIKIMNMTPEESYRVWSDKWYEEQASIYNDMEAKAKSQRPKFRTNGSYCMPLNEAAKLMNWSSFLKSASKNILKNL